MTGRDLEETVVNLEYLLASSRTDPAKREEYERQLQTFRVALEAATEQQKLLAFPRKRKFDSDTEVALMYAEEELFLTVRALLSGGDLAVGHQHLRWLLQHQHFLPLEVARCLRSLDEVYCRREDTCATDPAGAAALTTATMTVLDMVRAELGERVATLRPMPSVAPLDSQRRKR